MYTKLKDSSFKRSIDDIDIVDIVKKLIGQNCHFRLGCLGAATRISIRESTRNDTQNLCLQTEGR